MHCLYYLHVQQLFGKYQAFCNCWLVHGVSTAQGTSTKASQINYRLEKFISHPIHAVYKVFLKTAYHDLKLIQRNYNYNKVLTTMLNSTLAHAA